MTYWIASITEDNWNIIKKIKVYASRKNIRNKIVKGDKVIIYVPKKKSVKLGGCIVGILELRSDIYYEEKTLFHDEKALGKTLYPYRAKAEIICENRIPFKDLLHHLSFIVNKKKYMMYLQGNPANFGKPIPNVDAKIIVNKLMRR